MKRKHWCLILLVAVAPLGTSAQKIYVCKDAAGKTYTSDIPMQECKDRPMKELDKNGVVRREIAAPLTAEQKEHKRQEEERRKAEEVAIAEQRQGDKAMLARYRNEKDIEVARQRTLQPIREELKRENSALVQAEQNRKDVETRIEQAISKKLPYPALQAKLTESEKTVADIRQRRDAHQRQEAQVNSRFDAMLKRFRELTSTALSSASGAVK
jgi:actin-related protein